MRGADTTDRSKMLFQSSSCPSTLPSRASAPISRPQHGLIWGLHHRHLCHCLFHKFVGCATAARLTGFTTRESLAIGTLMHSCKGLVELIVLNLGLQAGILDQRVFSMFVVMPLSRRSSPRPSLFSSTPAHLRVSSDDDIVVWWTAKDRRIEDRSVKDKGEQGSGDGEDEEDNAGGLGGALGLRLASKKVLVVLDRFDHLAGLLTLVQLLRPSQLPPSSREAAASRDGLLRRRARQEDSDVSEKKAEEAESTSGHDTADDVALPTVSNGRQTLPMVAAGKTMPTTVRTPISTTRH
ncbi:hypothetical protein L7F22_012151 [Adiantum nelumboides]|nr:hypothetical protein [Adiantum nelumboides]